MVNILVVEDDREHFELLEEAIGNTLADYALVRFRDGKDFMQAIEGQVPPDLIFLDLSLPKRSGVDCLIEIRQRNTWKSTPVIIYSTSSDFEDIDQCYQNGCTLYLIKPPSFKELQAQVEKLFSRELALQALRRSEEQFHLLIQASATWFYKISADGTQIHTLAKEALEDLDTSFAGWLKQNVCTEDQLKIWEAVHAAVNSGKNLEVEFRMAGHEDTSGCALFRAIPVWDEKNRVKEWFIAVHDITARKTAEAEHRETELFLEQITDNTPHLIYVYDLKEHLFIYVNQRILELTGNSPDYVYGMGPHLFQKILHPEDLLKRADYLRNLSSLNPMDVKVQEFRIRVGEQYHWFRSKERVFKMDKGKVVQVIGLAEDISYEKRLNEILTEHTGGLGWN